MKLSLSSLIGPYLVVMGSPLLARSRMAISVPRLALRRGTAPRAVSRALASTARGRLPPEERAWIERIEARRRELGSKPGETRAGFAPEPGGLPEWAPAFDRPIPMSGATALLSIPPLWGRFLMRLVRERRPRSCLELGTAFGISTAFQAAALELTGDGRMLTIDAAREWATIAEEGFERLGLASRIEMRTGQIDSALPGALADVGPVDYAFIDAEHQEEPTLRYFELILPHLSSGAVLVLDDIGFPRQMRNAWRRISSHHRVSAAVGLGRMGVATIE
jgi:predicted O-methyltransferase YrrM